MAFEEDFTGEQLREQATEARRQERAAKAADVPGRTPENAGKRPSYSQAPEPSCWPSPSCQ